MRRVLFLLYALALGCRGAAGRGDDQDAAAPAQHSDPQAAAAAEHEMGGAGMTTAEDLHLRLTPARPPAPGDTARAESILVVMRQALAKYADVRVAVQDGYRKFLPGVALPVEHYTNLRWAWLARDTLDPARPTSLLYQHRPDGGLTLVGAMFTAPARMGDSALDARLPLSIARWHEHVNWCLPPLRARRRWGETRNGQPVFGPKSPIATEAECDAVGGRFRPRIFGWMLHVMAFSGGDPWAMHQH